MSERCERTSERRSEWPRTLSVDFISFETTVHRVTIKALHRGLEEKPVEFHLFVCFAELVSLTRSAALNISIARSLSLSSIS